MQALRKPLEKEVGITAPRHMRGDYYADSCFYKWSFSGFAYSRERHNASMF